MSDLEARLAAAKAKLAASEARRAEKLAAGATEAAVVAAERAATEAEALETAEAEHKRVAVVDTDMGIVILKRAHHLVFKRFQDLGKYDSVALEKLIGPCLVYPTADAFEKLCEELPATLARCADAIVSLAGMRAKETTGK